MPSNADRFGSKAPTGPRSEVQITDEVNDRFQAACRSERVDSLQGILETLSKRDAISLLHGEFPHKSKSWFERNLRYLTSMDSTGLYSLFGHKDPTARSAIRNLSRGQSANKVSPKRLAFSM